ncbi:hypothetical protein [Pelagicoccus mobilis]|uniref:Uncharacterized protein n=1 Tax=Pelagicoccus mobilis TaxID=415221 RepID=A0A934S0B9_9BACT|nr:hypothetical protein [Pelagicoccus mobilis]MBK1878654.1 hypothetical protein [Pelagicoccus mobilis]
MKTIATLTLLAAIAAFMSPQQAVAGDKEKALIGGLIGGIIIGSALADDHTHVSTTVSYHHGNHGHHRSHCNHGHWKWTSTKHWVPGHYKYSRDCHGHSVKIWVSGYYDYHKEKVWVKDCRCSHYTRSSRGHHYRYDSHKSHHDHYRHHGKHGRGSHHDRGHRDHRHHSSTQIVRNY